MDKRVVIRWTAALCLLLSACSHPAEEKPDEPLPTLAKLAMLTKSVSLTSGGEAYVDFKVNPYEAAFDYDVENGRCAISLSNQYGTEAAFSFRIKRIAPLSDSYADVGKYRVWLEDSFVKHTYEELCCLQLTDAYGRKSRSDGFKVNCACDPATRAVLDLGLPLVRIITENGEEPRCDYVSCPPGCMGGGIRNATKVPGSVTILSGDEIRYASGNYKKDASGMTVKIRGNTSAYPAKKPFKIKLQKKADLLGRGNDAKYKDKEWLLLRYDQLKMLAGSKVNELIGMSWTPAFQFVNLVFNGDYRGVYMLAESVKRNEDCRLRVSKAGYVIEYDAYWWNEDVTFTNGWNPSMAYTFKYPDSDDVTPEEVAYIRKYIGRVESAIVDGTYEQRIDVVSFARWLAAHDILGSLDGAGSNMYLTKYDATDNSKLEMANLWDFDGIYQRKDTWATAHIWGANYFPTLLSSTNPAFREAYANVCEGNARTICKVTANYLKNFANSDTGKALDASLVQDNKRWHGGEVPVEQCYMVAKEWFDSRPGWLLNAVASLR